MRTGLLIVPSVCSRRISLLVLVRSQSISHKQVKTGCYHIVTGEYLLSTKSFSRLHDVRKVECFRFP